MNEGSDLQPDLNSMGFVIATHVDTAWRNVNALRLDEASDYAIIMHITYSNERNFKLHARGDWINDDDLHR